MSSTFGNKLKISIFGQSHGEAIGVLIDGLPCGFTINMDELLSFLARRAPGQGSFTTSRRESDIPKILSGVVNGVTCGAPISAIVENKDKHSGDYDELFYIPRPGHADNSASVKIGGFQDVRGGGHFSGRLTAPLCIAGAISIQMLKARGINVGAHIARIGNVCDTPFDPCAPALDLVSKKGLATISHERSQQMLSVIESAKMEGDSVGGVIECAVTGLPAGVGAPMFDGVENRISSVAFGVPAVSGIEFGSGFGGTELMGSQNNDPFIMKNGAVATSSNNHGGILGGITTAMPIIFRAAVKPTPSIAKKQHSVNLKELKECTLEIKGRHDPCIVPRAVPCIESVAAIAILDLLLEWENEQ